MAVRAVEHLRELLDSWDGALASPSLLVSSAKEARSTAKRRVERMVDTARRREQANAARQLDAARQRLTRELGRTLRCFADGDLRRVFEAQLQREQSTDGRYHQALQLLGNSVVFDTGDATSFVAGMKESARRARLAGSELDAALDDPRWRLARA